MMGKSYAAFARRQQYSSLEQRFERILCTGGRQSFRQEGARSILLVRQEGSASEGWKLFGKYTSTVFYQVTDCRQRRAPELLPDRTIKEERIVEKAENTQWNVIWFDQSIDLRLIYWKRHGEAPAVSLAVEAPTDKPIGDDHAAVDQ